MISEKARLTEIMRKQSDRNGDQKLSTSEVAAWFSMKLGPKVPSEKLNDFISLFDTNYDSCYVNVELQHVFDAMAELPTSNQAWKSEIDTLDNDRSNMYIVAISALGFFFVVILIAIIFFHSKTE
jgi:hypothetical protein